jgi:hypothetical protein
MVLWDIHFPASLCCITPASAGFQRFQKPQAQLSMCDRFLVLPPWVQLSSHRSFPALLCTRDGQSYPLVAALHRTSEVATVLSCGWFQVPGWKTGHI